MKIWIISFTLMLSGLSKAQQPEIFRDTQQPIEKRVSNLLSSLTLKEKISLLGFNTRGVPRLNIPAYNWWNEALHGIARGGEATVFPQAIAMAATFDTSLIFKVADFISTEARAKYNLTTRLGRYLQYEGLNFWTPNINIFRDPRWGRGQETYGEDPYLTASVGLAFVKGLQGNTPGILKTAACAKHFAVHSGPEKDRHSFNAIVDEKDLRETYLYAFKKLVDHGVEAVMCGYNRVNGQPCCTGDILLQQILRQEWGFQGHVVTDCWALDDIWLRHKSIPTRVEVAAAAVKAGVNLDCANILQEDVATAIEKGLLTQADVDTALSGTLRTLFKLDFFSDPNLSPYKNYLADSVHNPSHIALVRKVAAESMVLLKNNGVLPLQKEKVTSLMITGANSSSIDVLLGNYHGIGGNLVTFAEGISAAFGPETAVQYDQGCDYTDTVHFGGIWASQSMDVTIAVIGLTPLLEGEEGDAFLSKSGGDKNSLSLPDPHVIFLRKLREASKKPIIAVVTAGSAVDIQSIEPYADAIIMAWYPGEQGGNALADLILGKASPCGRLPVTFYKSLSDLPDYKDYQMKGRTYRYFGGEVQYPFGFGLSYTSFEYSWIQVPVKRYTSADSVKFAVKIKNTGNYNGAEVVQAYIRYPDQDRMPIKELKAFKKVFIPKGNEVEVELSIPVKELQKWDLSIRKWKLYPGTYNLIIGKNANEPILNNDFLVK